MSELRWERGNDAQRYTRIFFIKYYHEDDEHLKEPGLKLASLPYSNIVGGGTAGETDAFFVAARFMRFMVKYGFPFKVGKTSEEVFKALLAVFSNATKELIELAQVVGEYFDC